MNWDGKSSYSIYSCIEDKIFPIWATHTEQHREPVPSPDIFACTKAGSPGSVIASVHICCFIISSNPLDLNNNRNRTESTSPPGNCKPLSLLFPPNVIQIYVPSDSLFTALHLHYVELKNRNRYGLVYGFMKWTRFHISQQNISDHKWIFWQFYPWSGMRPSCSRSRSTCQVSTEWTSRSCAGRTTSTRSRRSPPPTRPWPCSSWPRSTGGDINFLSLWL